MFATFQAGKQGGAGEGGESSKGSKGTSRRITTPIACVECRRRKIRCDGLSPCAQCRWYQHPEACVYAKPAQRLIPSRKLLEKLSSTIEQHQLILLRLFGTRDLDSLTSLPRDGLLNLALSTPDASASPTPSMDRDAIQSSHLEGLSTLEALEQLPELDYDLVQEKQICNTIQDIQDDINGLSLQATPTTYVGISSLNAALKVIYRTTPAAQSISIEKPQSIVNVDRLEPLMKQDPYTVPEQRLAHALISSYFEYIHPFCPMVDEAATWKTYSDGKRKDHAWMALLNMIFTLGSVASRPAENMEHVVYFSRACTFLGIRLDVSKVATLEALQALSLIAGYYMHYLNRPNKGDSMMGACIRVACQLGLHREFAGSMNTEVWKEDVDSDRAEIRRRTWWSLYCMDTWASTTTGRPSLGRLAPGVSVKQPGQDLNPKDPNNLKLLPLIHNIEFCKLATQIQDQICATPLLSLDKVMQLDGSLAKWWQDLPPILTKEPAQGVPSHLRVPRMVMKWRCQNLRILLHRPYLLSTALNKIQYPDLSEAEKVAVDKCRIMAARTIQSISAECKAEVIAAWNGVWMIYQAAFVPLISLFTDFASAEEREAWKGQLNSVREYLRRMKSHALSAAPSLDALSKLIEAAKDAEDAENAQRRQQEALRLVIAQRDQRQHPALQTYLPGEGHSPAPLTILTTMPHSLHANDLLHSAHSSPTPSFTPPYPAAMSSINGSILGTASRSVPQTPTGHFTHPSQQFYDTHHHHHHMHQHEHRHHLQQASLGGSAFWDDDTMWDTFSQEAAAHRQQQQQSQTSRPEVQQHHVGTGHIDASAPHPGAYHHSSGPPGHQNTTPPAWSALNDGTQNWDFTGP